MNKRLTYKFDGDDSSFIFTKNTAFFPYPCPEFNVCSPIAATFKSGYYRFELWGAQGGNARYGNQPTINNKSAGRGAYVSGILPIGITTTFYLYIGGKGEDQWSEQSGVVSSGGYNGRGSGGIDLCVDTSPESSGGGGGSTDVRIINGTSKLALMSRIIVAGAGAGAESNSNNAASFGGSGGILEGLSKNNYVRGGSQTQGLFGYGADGFSFDTQYHGWPCGGSIGGSGSGYFGGYILYSHEYLSDNLKIELGGAGGSSFVSGCHECKAVNYEESGSITFADRSTHYSGWVFTNITMKSGIDPMNIPNTEEIETGHEGSGAILITYLGPLFQRSSYQKIRIPILFFYSFPFSKHSY